MGLIPQSSLANFAPSSLMNPGDQDKRNVIRISITQLDSKRDEKLSSWRISLLFHLNELKTNDGEDDLQVGCSNNARTFSHNNFVSLSV